MTERTKPYLRTRVAGDECDIEGCTKRYVLIRVNPKGEPGVFMCEFHALQPGMEHSKTMKIRTPPQEFFRNGRRIKTEGRVHYSMGIIKAPHYKNEGGDTGKFHVICNQRGYFGTIVDDETEVTCKSCLKEKTGQV